MRRYIPLFSGLVLLVAACSDRIPRLVRVTCADSERQALYVNPLQVEYVRSEGNHSLLVFVGDREGAVIDCPVDSVVASLGRSTR
jgi:hypothetical protein